MATYKYQQPLPDGSREGYIQYNITPDFGGVLSVGERFEIVGKIYSRDFKCYGITVEAALALTDYDFLDNAKELGRVAVTCNKGGTATFSITGSVTQALADLASTRNFQAFLGFTMYDDAEMSGGSGTKSSSGQKLSLLKSRIVPEIRSVTLVDRTMVGDTSALQLFGGAVDGKSQLALELDVVFDPLDPAVTLMSARLEAGINYLQGETLVENTVDIGVPNFSGSYENYSVIITDSKANSSVYAGGELIVYPYVSPRLYQLTDEAVAQRYSVHLNDANEKEYRKDDGGSYLWATFGVDVCAINEKNAWAVTREYALAGITPGNLLEVFSGTAGESFTAYHDRTVFPEEVTFSPLNAYTVKITLKDSFEEVTLVATVNKSKGYFNVEKHGVAAGMRTTASEGNPKFESAYPVYPYAGIEGATNYKEGEETTYGKWIDGKTIYRQVVPINVTQTGTTIDVITVADVEQLLRIEGCYVDADGACYPPTFFFTTSNYIATYWADNTLRIRSTRALTGYAILSYTKTIEDDNGGDSGDSGDTEATVVRPAAAMTGYSSQGCVASASSEYSDNTYAAWRAFNKSYSDQYGWAAKSGVLDAWLQLEMDVALKKISVTIINRTYTYVNGPENGVIYGSNDGAEWTSIGTFGGRDGSTKGGKTVHECSNNEIAYKYVRVNVSRSSGGLVAIGEMIIEGVEVS